MGLLALRAAHVADAGMGCVLALVQVVIEPMEVVLDLLVVEDFLVDVVVDVEAEGPDPLRLSLRGRLGVDGIGGC